MLTNIFKLSKVLENIRETSNVLILPFSHFALIFPEILLPFYPFSTSLGSLLTINKCNKITGDVFSTLFK